MNQGVREALVTPPRPWTLPEVALVTMGVLLLLWQPAFFLNDELSQALGHRALAEGSLETTILGPGYEAIQEGVYTHHTLEALEKGPVRMSGSDMENVIGLPFRALLVVLSVPLGLGAAMGLLAGTGIGAATWALARRRTTQQNARWLGLAVASLLFLGAVLRPDRIAMEPFLDVASLQLATMTWTAVAAALWFDLVRKTWGPNLAWVGVGLWLCATPVLFWSLDIKYHGLAMALHTAAIWAYRDGARTPPARTFLAASLVGLAVWNHAPSGGLLGAALLLAALPGLRGGKAFLPRIGAGLTGIALGLVPAVLWRILETLPVPASNKVAGGAGAIVDGTTATGAGESIPDSVVVAAVRSGTRDGGVFSGAIWNDPTGALDVLRQTFVWAEWLDLSAALPMLAWAPWVLLAIVTLARSDLRARVGPLWPVAALYMVVPIFLVGTRMLDVGTAFDPRHHATAWPWLVLLAWPALAERFQNRPAPWWLGQVLVAGGLILATFLTINLLWHKSTGTDVAQMGFEFESVWLHRWVGITLAALLLGWIAVGRWLQQHWPALPCARIHDALLAWSIGSSVSLGLWLRLAGAHAGQPETSTRFAAWPVDLLSAALRWVGYSY